MARSALAEAGEALVAADEESPPGRLPAAPPARPDAPPARLPAAPPARRWTGAGGRWLVWAGRAVAWAVLLLVGYRGVLAIVTGGQGSASPGQAAAAAASGRGSFPAALAGAFVLEFGQAYLNFSPATAAARRQDLARFLAPGADPQLGWNGAGSQQLRAEQVASVTVTGSHSAIVTLLATLSTGQMLELAVPVYADGGGLVVSGPPALLPGPARATLPAAGAASSDPAAEAQLRAQLPAFFAAYASGNAATLARFTAPGSHIAGLGGTVAFGRIDSVFAPPGGARRVITVTVTWKLPAARPATAAATLRMAYRLTVLRRGANWDVQSVGAQGPS